MVNGIVVDLYVNSGCHNNDQAADVALSYIDNGKLCNHIHIRTVQEFDRKTSN